MNERVTLENSAGILVEALETPGLIDTLGWIWRKFGVLGSLFQHPEFWSAIAGAVVGGLIAFGVQIIALREARKQRGDDRTAMLQTLGRALIIKLARLHSDLHQIGEHIEDGYERSKREGEEPWEVVETSANPPEEIHFSAEETGMLLSIGSNDVFNDILQLEVTHNTVVDTMKFLVAERIALDNLPSVPPQIGQHALDMIQWDLLREDRQRQRSSKQENINRLIIGIHELMKQHEGASGKALSDLQNELNEKLGMTLQVSPVSPQGSESEPASVAPPTAAPAPVGGA